MRIILSRKGFDSTFGKMTNLIVNNKELVMIPIPEQCSSKKLYKYEDLKNLSHDEQLEKFIKEEILKRVDNEYCHADPDLVNFHNEPNFKGVLGQVDTAQRHLKKNNVGKGDIFIFFGLFANASIVGNKLEIDFKSKKHIIYGYLQVGEFYDKSKFHEITKKEYSGIRENPHLKDDFYKENETNTIYVASEKLTIGDQVTDYKGYGIFNYNESLNLTIENEDINPNHLLTCWNLPSMFKGCEITYHNKEKSQKPNCFMSAKRGQEFIVKDFNDEKQLKEWFDEVFKGSL